MQYQKEPREEPFGSYHVPEEISDTVADVVADVRAKGDEAVLSYTERFDEVVREQNALSASERADAIDAVSDTERRLIDNSIQNVRRFAEAQREHVEEFEIEVGDGRTLGQRIVPVERVGAYVPGGQFPLLSSAVMAVVPADVAGVDTVVAAMPPQDDGTPHPAAVYGADRAGADEIYVVGGAQAIAAMAIGTEEIPPVDLVVGPGNVFTTEAKRQVYGEVGIDLLAGPSEILVLADETGDPDVIAADLLAQAEHDTAARPLLVTTSAELGNAVLSAVQSQLETLSTAAIARDAWNEKGTVILADDLEEAYDVSDELAPEHLEVHTEDPRRALENLSNYGTLFLGEESANVFSDKLIGTNHILPTQRAARYTAGLSVHTFIKNQTFQDVSSDGAAALEPWATKQSVIERLEGHAKSSFVRSPGNDLSDYDTVDHDLPPR